jgi:hypothetical protein
VRELITYRKNLVQSRAQENIKYACMGDLAVIIEKEIKAQPGVT